MKVIAYTALHYGSPYLAYAILSIIDHVDEYHVLYSPNGSHGWKSSMSLPESESRENLMRIAQGAAGSKLHWHEGNWTHEGNQRDAIYQIVPDADVILVLDYDEIWSDAKGVIESVTSQFNELSRYRVPMIHFWRSFNNAILHDPAYPVRVLYPNGFGDEFTRTRLLETAPILHLGYAIPDYLMEYKRHIHGHKAEWRTDIDWWRDRWMNKHATMDLHPVGSEFWNIEKINPVEYFPAYMKLHPYWGMERIT